MKKLTEMIADSTTLINKIKRNDVEGFNYEEHPLHESLSEFMTEIEPELAPFINKQAILNIIARSYGAGADAALMVLKYGQEIYEDEESEVVVDKVYYSIDELSNEALLIASPDEAVAILKDGLKMINDLSMAQSEAGVLEIEEPDTEDEEDEGHEVHEVETDKRRLH